MASVLQMLALSPTMEKGTINQWFFEEGARVEAGEILCEVETDKAAMDYESSESGTLLKILAPVGSELEVGDPLAILGEEDDDVTALANQLQSKKTTEPAKAEKPAATKAAPEKTTADATTPDKKKTDPTDQSDWSDQSEKLQPAPAPSSRAAASHAVSPVAARLAAERGVNLSLIKGSGPGGRVIKRDIEQAATQTLQPAKTPGASQKPDSSIESIKSISSIPAPPPAAIPIPIAREVPLSRNRKILAERLTQSKQAAPHFYVTNPILMDALVEARKRLNAALEPKGEKLGVNEFLIKACALALEKHPGVNASFLGDRIVEYGEINIGLAVALEEGNGLITPVVRQANTKSLRDIGAELADLVARARAGKLRPEEFQTGTFTISNLGMYGVDHFTAIVNPPQSAILAVGATKPEPVVDDKGRIAVHQIMRVTLSCDHRSVDGVAGARFLQDIKTLLENPLSMLL
jgi:pyruvate dehydrogenase E2 component (dihydrolipoamide acetyltransferase)